MEDRLDGGVVRTTHIYAISYEHGLVICPKIAVQYQR